MYTIENNFHKNKSALNYKRPAYCQDGNKNYTMEQNAPTKQGNGGIIGPKAKSCGNGVYHHFLRVRWLWMNRKMIGEAIYIRVSDRILTEFSCISGDCACVEEGRPVFDSDSKAKFHITKSIFHDNFYIFLNISSHIVVSYQNQKLIFTSTKVCNCIIFTSRGEYNIPPS
jgi:hypothetical protein